MGRIARVDTSQHYKDLKRSSDDVNERADCSVVAVAAVAGVDYRSAHDAMTNAGRRRGTGASTRQIIDAAESFGFNCVRIQMIEKIRQYPGRHAYALKNVTTHHPDRFKHVWRDGHNYLFFNSSHVAAVVNGENVDWSKGRAKRCVSIYRVDPK